MLTYSVTIKGDTLDKLQRQFAQAPRITARHILAGMNKSLVGYQATAKQFAPVDKGILRGGILMQPATEVGPGSFRGSVSATAPHSLWQERGTGIYGPFHTPIRPKTRKVLAWQSGGSWHFAKEVRGSKPRWYMRTSVEQNESRTNRNLADAVEGIAKELAGGTS